MTDEINSEKYVPLVKHHYPPLALWIVIFHSRHIFLIFPLSALTLFVEQQAVLLSRPF